MVDEGEGEGVELGNVENEWETEAEVVLEEEITIELGVGEVVLWEVVTVTLDTNVIGVVEAEAKDIADAAVVPV